ncbi:cupin domain-containing protein [Halococcus dombrowskii]|uniref:Cupin domain-containing protein n=1 Tax=Halococcus dombrowskii TaxID=179637 RepID=A0AAV3SD36_HALDO|nr:cupin domain-containing protein [Halococcus dombrowskii]UOO94443.1 cupin domain-containing protein [Halococcus dombrowskii]
MESVRIRDVGPSPTETGAERRTLADPLGTTDIAINHYVLEPGERFAASLHAHPDQEEVFVVLAGEATFETRSSGEPSANEREITVGENEAIRFAPGEFQTGRNTTDERVVALALGAPRDSEEVRIARIPEIGEIACTYCSRGDMRVRNTGTDLVCPDCEATLAVE